MNSKNEAWKRNLPIPFFSQRENIYVWFRYDEDNIKVKDKKTGKELPGISLAHCSCNITSLCMILQYFGITDDSPDDMMKKVFEVYFKEWAQEKDGVAVYDAATMEYQKSGTFRLEYVSNMKRIVHKLYGVPEDRLKAGVNWEKNSLSLEVCHSYIAAGYPVWFSFGSLSSSQSGHIAVLRGFTPEGDVIINDPWGDAADPFGYLKSSGTPGYYYQLNDNAMNERGLGSGDNVVIKKKDFQKIIKTPLHQSLVITIPQMWDFPVKMGLKESVNSDRREDILNAVFARECWEKKHLLDLREVINGYPLSENGKWHNGIHIGGSEREAIYPIGPGRLVMAKNAELQDGTSYNFVLVRHWVPAKKESEAMCFYSCYMHLAPIDIKKRIQERFSFSEEQNENVQKEVRSWLDQLIDHIVPKKAFVRIEDVASGDDLKSIPVYKKDGCTQITTLKDRAHIYLCPVNTEFKKLMETVEVGENEAQLKKLYMQLNDIETYTYKNAAGKIYYRIFTKLKEESGDYTWQDGFVETNNIIQLPLNVKEYTYYRRKLVSLLNGDTVVFNDEDTDSSAAETTSVQKENWKEVQLTLVKSVFPFVSGSQDTKVQFDEIQKYYLDMIKAVRTGGSTKSRVDIVWNHLIYKFTCLSALLLSYPLNQVNELFKITDKWVTDSMKSVFVNCYKSVFDDEKAELHWNFFVTHISVYCPRNIDYHVEVHAKIPIGTIGMYKKKNQIHYEVFSEKELIAENEKSDTGTYKHVKVKNALYYNKKETVKLFAEAGIFQQNYFSFLPHDVITANELGLFYKENQAILRHLVVKHINLHEIKDENGFKKMIKDTFGYFERNEKNEQLLYRQNPEAFLNNTVKKELSMASDDAVWFYHPVQILLWLNEKQRGFAANL